MGTNHRTRETYGRRLADKVKAAVDHARQQGRDEAATRLQTIYEAILKDDIRYEHNRRKSSSLK